MTTMMMIMTIMIIKKKDRKHKVNILLHFNDEVDSMQKCT